MNIFKHNQIKGLAMAAALVIIAHLSVLADESSLVNNSQQKIMVATPVYSQQQVKKARSLTPKLLTKTFPVSQKKASPPPLYRPNGELKNDLASRLTDPQRKESPIRTARLFKIQVPAPQ